jgi:alkaline phosphatase D
VSSVPFTRNWRGPESIDSWAGYLNERQVILDKMWKTEGVVVISGVRKSKIQYDRGITLTRT